MSKKQFEVLFYGDVINCVRDETGREYNLHETITILNEQQATIQSLKEENRKLRNIHLSIDLTYSYGYGRYLADVRVIDDE